MRNYKTIFMFIVAMSFAVSALIFVVSSVLAMEEKESERVRAERSRLKKEWEAKKKELRKPQLPDKMPDEILDELMENPDFIVEEGDREQLGSTTDEEGNTVTVYKTKDGVWVKETRDKDGKVKETTDREDVGGTDTVKHVDHERGVTTVTTTAPDGSKTEETRDNKTGETLTEIGISANGKQSIYQTGPDAKKAFEAGERIAKAEYLSLTDFVQGGGAFANNFYHKNQAEIDRQLIDQMKGGKAVTGGNTIVSGNFNERSKSLLHESQNGKSATDTQYLAMRSEAKAVNPAGQYGVKAVGEPVSAKGVGKSPSEALSSFRDSAAYTVVTKIKSEFIDHVRSTQKTTGGKTEENVKQSISENLDASSFVVFDSYEVKSVRKDEEGNYVVEGTATPGITVRK